MYRRNFIASMATLPLLPSLLTVEPQGRLIKDPQFHSMSSIDHNRYYGLDDRFRFQVFRSVAHRKNDQRYFNAVCHTPLEDLGLTIMTERVPYGQRRKYVREFALNNNHQKYDNVLIVIFYDQGQAPNDMKGGYMGVLSCVAHKDENRVSHVTLDHINKDMKTGMWKYVS